MDKNQGHENLKRHAGGPVFFVYSCKEGPGQDRDKGEYLDHIRGLDCADYTRMHNQEPHIARQRGDNRQRRQRSAIRDRIFSGISSMTFLSLSSIL